MFRKESPRAECAEQVTALWFRVIHRLTPDMSDTQSAPSYVDVVMSD